MSTRSNEWPGSQKGTSGQEWGKTLQNVPSENPPKLELEVISGVVRTSPESCWKSRILVGLRVRNGFWTVWGALGVKNSDFLQKSRNRNFAVRTRRFTGRARAHVKENFIQLGLRCRVQDLLADAEAN